MIEELRSYVDESDYDFDPDATELFRRAAGRIEALRAEVEGTADGR